jgi:hypothetical protein
VIFGVLEGASTLALGILYAFPFLDTKNQL